MTTAAHLNLLRRMPVLAGLNNQSLEILLDGSSLRSWQPGESIFREGDQATSFYVIQQGEVLVEKQWKETPVPLGRFATGDCIGEMAIIDLQSRSASVTATQITEAIEIPRQVLLKLYQENVEQYAIIMMNMGREVSRRLRAADDRLFAIQQEHGFE